MVWKWRAGRFGRQGQRMAGIGYGREYISAADTCVRFVFPAPFPVLRCMGPIHASSITGMGPRRPTGSQKAAGMIARYELTGNRIGLGSNVNVH